MYADMIFEEITAACFSNNSRYEKNEWLYITFPEKQHFRQKSFINQERKAYKISLFESFKKLVCSVSCASNRVLTWLSVIFFVVQHVVLMRLMTVDLIEVVGQTETENVKMY